MKTTSKGNWFPCWVFIVFENNLVYRMIDQFIQISYRKEDKQYINSTNEIYFSVQERRNKNDRY